MKNIRERGRRLGLLLAVHFGISAFTFGGGYVVVPMMRRQFVERRKLLSEQELLDMAAVSQSAPGAIAVNLAALVGYRVCGMAGTLISCVGAVAPALLLLSVISHFYEAFRSSAAAAALLHGMEAGAAALIVDLAVDMSRAVFRRGSPLLTLLVPASFAAGFFWHVPVLYILLAAAALCLGAPFLRRAREDRV